MRDVYKNCGTGGIVVDPQKLSHGLTRTFEGISIIFESLGSKLDVRDLKELTELTEQVAEPKVSAEKPEEETSKNVSETNSVTSETSETPEASTVTANSEISDKLPETNPKVSSEKNETSEATAKTHEQAEHSEQNERNEQPQHYDTAKAAKSCITADDITKVIVEKLKQDRDNNKKIEALVHKYGVSVISQLTEEKYEAFMTELVSL